VYLVLIKPSNIGGVVASIFYSLYRGLAKDGVHTDVIRLGDPKNRLISTFYDDILSMKHLKKHDLVLYIGSIPWPSHMLAKLSGIPSALFLHGYVYHELFHAILYKRGIRNKLGALINAILFKSAASLNTIDLYISPSLSVCDSNKISDNFVLLPQFIFPEDFRDLSKKRSNVKEDTVVRMVAYTSYIDSPRLLNVHHLIVLAKIIEHMVRRKFELIIVDPKGSIPSSPPRKNRKTFVASKFFITFSFRGPLYRKRN